MTETFLIILSYLSLCNSQFLMPSTNSSLITVTEFKELVDLIGEEKQLRHALEHNVASLQQQLSINEVAYKRLENDYKNLSQAYNSLRTSNTDLQRQFAEMKLTNQSIQATLATTTADVSELQRKSGMHFVFTFSCFKIIVTSFIFLLMFTMLVFQRRLDNANYWYM